MSKETRWFVATMMFILALTLIVAGVTIISAGP